jgi:hypothetical protein
MPDEKLDLYRKLEPISRVLRALGLPPPEAFIPTPAEILADLGVPTIEEIMPAIKEEIRGKVRGLR